MGDETLPNFHVGANVSINFGLASQENLLFCDEQGCEAFENKPKINQATRTKEQQSCYATITSTRATWQQTSRQALRLLKLKG